MVPDALTVVFTVIGGFAGAVYLIEVSLRIWRRIRGGEDGAGRILAEAMADEIEERLIQAVQPQVEALEGLSQGFRTEMVGLHGKLDGLAQALEGLKRQE